jgi:ABC-2 type transport system permease protein
VVLAKPLIEGLSGAIVTGSSLSSNLGALAVIAGWGVVGIWLAVRGFSWEGRRG